MKKIIFVLLAVLAYTIAKAQPAEGAYFSNTELQLHPRKIITPNGTAYMWSDCYEQLNFAQRADLKLYYDSALKATNNKIEEAVKANNLANPTTKSDTGYLEADKSFYIRKLKYINDYDAWEEKQ